MKFDINHWSTYPTWARWAVILTGLAFFPFATLVLIVAYLYEEHERKSLDIR